MSIFKEVYDILKDLLVNAKQAKNAEVLQLAMDLQEKFFELREENDNLNNELKCLKDKIKDLETANIMEEELDYSPRGFVCLKNDQKKIPYCSCCWKREHKLIPLSQERSYFEYACGNCHSKVIVNYD